MAKRDTTINGQSGVSRRDLLKYSVLTVGVSAAPLSANVALDLAGGGGPSNDWPEFLIKREVDELFLRVRAIGFRAKTGAGKLQPVRWAGEHLLEFTLPPQHFSETAIQVSAIADVDDKKLRDISVTPSRPTKLVFRVPAKPIALRLEDLLNWSSFELLLPDVTKAGKFYQLEIPRVANEAISRIELPWGIELAPADPNSKLTFTGSMSPRAAGNWSELWSTSLTPTDAKSPPSPVRMEIFSVRGFVEEKREGSIDQGTFVVSYKTKIDGPAPPSWPVIDASARAELAASLSRRFPYTGRVKPKRASAQLRLLDENNFLNAAHESGRAISVDQFRLSSRGATLQLLARFEPPPESALSSWAHSSLLGRDTFDEIVREGFLYPFGTPCQLIEVSQRVFTKDGAGHFVGPLVKQVFLRVHQPNAIEIGHGESPFRRISITTELSPPLDLPPTNSLSDYAKYHFFMPKVGGVPFAFDHVGTDWDGEQHRSSMPHFFVSNKVTSANGLIWEPGYSWPPDQARPVFDPNFHIPESGEGLRVVDRAWMAESARFARYGSAVVSLARSSSKGSTAQKLDWVEWTRGNIADPEPAEKRAWPPFEPRARTMRVQAQAAGHLSGEPTAMLASYRDLRFVAAPYLDPEPTTPITDYFANVTAARDDPDTPYLYMLETRSLIAETGHPAQRKPDEIAADVRSLYYRTSRAPMPIELFQGISNEITFGRSQSADSIGGLSVPETHASIANRRFGIVGDASFDERRWPGKDKAMPRLESTGRLDFAAYAKASRTAFDQTPFDATRLPDDRTRLVADARKLMGYRPPVPALLGDAIPAGAFAPGLKLGDLFGADAEIIPGLRFSDILGMIMVAGSAGGGRPALVGGEPKVGEPLAWNVKLTGIEWLDTLQENIGSAPSLATVLAELIADAGPAPTARPLALGLEARLSWSNTAFEEVPVGPVKFIPNASTKIDIDALARLDLGVPTIESNPPRLGFQPGKPRIRAKTSIVRFAIEIFGAIRLGFETVSFEVDEGGSKSFDTRLSSVELIGALAFINQLQTMLAGLGGDSGIKVDIGPQRAQISQTLQFPMDGRPLLIGPAQVTNLSMFWAVTIPLMGRDVLSVAFGISSREKPLTIFVPPWYGGKAYVLIEATTRGCRLLEVSMEYGALIPIEWGPARGQASLMAGIFFQLRKLDAADSAEVTLTGFVKAASHLTVAGIIRFSGLIYISLEHIDRAGESIVRGTSTVKVSVKIAFVRYSYSFTAVHEKRRASTGNTLAALVKSTGPNILPISVDEGRTGTTLHGAALPYGRGYTPAAQEARNRLFAAYRSERQAA